MSKLSLTILNNGPGVQIVQVEVRKGRLIILQEGKACKFKRQVQEKTFAGCSRGGRQVLYVTERCVFKLIDTDDESRLQLIEVAPGIRTKEDVLDKMEFAPVVKKVVLMDQRCFLP